MTTVSRADLVRDLVAGGKSVSCFRPFLLLSPSGLGGSHLFPQFTPVGLFLSRIHCHLQSGRISKYSLDYRLTREHNSPIRLSEEQFPTVREEMHAP
jgi:hypothetical protein